MQTNILDKIMEILKKDDSEIKKEAIWALSNTTSNGSQDQLRRLVERGAISAFCAILSSPDARSVAVSLEGLNNILKIGDHNKTPEGENPITLQVEECGGIDLLENLQYHPNQQIYNKALTILEKYF